MERLFYNARLVLPHAVVPGALLLQDGKIAAVLTGEAGAAAAREPGATDLLGNFLAPGFVETHVHGGGGADFNDATPEAFLTAASTHLAHGVTTLYPTLVAAEHGEICRAIDAFKAARQQAGSTLNLAGLHLEGPYLNPAQKGAIDAQYIRTPQREEVFALLQRGDGLIARWTFAPELPGALTLIDDLLAAGVLPSMGHSDAEYSQVKAAYERGAHMVTHLYSAMSTIVRREGFRFSGLLESAFCLEGMQVEIIADGCHLPPELLRMVWRLLGPDRVSLTSDAIRCAGVACRESVIGSLQNGQRIIIEDDVAKLPDRSAFAGSIATGERLVRVMHQSAGVPLHDCVRMHTLTPARLMGIDGRKGSLLPGKDGDLCCFDEQINILGVRLSSTGSGILG